MAIGEPIPEESGSKVDVDDSHDVEEPDSSTKTYIEDFNEISQIIHRKVLHQELHAPKQQHKFRNFNEALEACVERGCLRDVLSSLRWNMVMNELLKLQQKAGDYTLEYAEI